MRKALSYLLILTLLFTVSACSSNNSTDSDNTGSSSSVLEFLTYNFNGNKLAIGYKVTEISQNEIITVKAINQNGNVENFKFTAEPIEEKQIAIFDLSNTNGEITFEFSAKSAQDTKNRATLVFNNKRPQLSTDSVTLVMNSLTEGEMARLLVGYFGPSEDKVVQGSYQLNAIERFGIPNYVMADAGAGVRIFPAFTTWYPSALSIASSWDTEVAYMVGEAIGNEAKVMGVDCQLGPGLNLHRSVLAGRNSEYSSEDPFLSGVMTGHYVVGMQSTGTHADLKHYVANNQETNRYNMSANVSERVLRELYIKNFGYAIKIGNPKTIMTSYNKVNGIFTSNFADLIRVLREEFDYDGVITTDWSTNADVIQNILVGNDLTNPGNKDQYNAVEKALKDGTIPKEIALKSVERVLKLIVSSNSMGNYRTDEIDDEKGKEIAYKAAMEGMVLLKNTANTLPFTSGEVALFGVGSYTTIKGLQGAGWINSKENINIDAAFKQEDSGYTLNKTMAEVYKGKDSHWETMPSEPIIPDEKITKSANEADIAIITISRLSMEGTDNKNEKGQFLLADDEVSIIDRVTAAYHSVGKKVIVVINSCYPIETVSWRDKVDAILFAAPGGKMVGAAIRDVIKGKVNPSGKLSATWPVLYEDTSCAETFGDKYNSDYTEGLYVGYRDNVSNNLRYAYEFGYGISYTKFSYSDFKISKNEFTTKDDTITAEVTVTNTGNVAGKEVVQLYVSKPETLADQVARELVGFGKTELLAPGESETIKITITSYELESFIDSRDSWVVSNGSYTLYAAASSFDIKYSAKFTVPNEIVTSTVTTDLTGLNK